MQSAYSNARAVNTVAKSCGTGMSWALPVLLLSCHARDSMRPTQPTPTSHRMCLQIGCHDTSHKRGRHRGPCKHKAQQGSRSRGISWAVVPQVVLKRQVETIDCKHHAGRMHHAAGVWCTRLVPAAGKVVVKAVCILQPRLCTCLVGNPSISFLGYSTQNCNTRCKDIHTSSPAPSTHQQQHEAAFDR